jgi:integrase
VEAARKRQAKRHVTATTLLVSEETGQPYKTDDFRHQFARIRDAAAAHVPELEGLQFRHFRHTAVTRLATAGVDNKMISRVTGQSIKSIEGILEHYLIGSAELAGEAFRLRM